MQDTHGTDYAAGNKTLSILSAALLRAAPDFPYNEAEIQSGILQHGLSGFISTAGGHAAALAETAELLSKLERGVAGGKR